MRRGKPRLIVVLGPTASGKSRYAIQLAKKVDGEIVSFDAMQLYRGLPVLTNQPSEKDQKGIRHHLIGFLPLSKEFSAAHFSKKAKEAIQGISRRKKVPILVGGSGFYLKALLEGVPTPAKADPAIRKKYLAFLKKKGSASLYERLRSIDPKRAAKIHPNDAYRLMRALEIFEATGKKPSEFERGKGGISEFFRIQKIGLRVPRKVLYAEIDRRVEEMVRRGALREVQKARSKRVSATAKKIIGLEELSLYLRGKRSLEEAIGNIQKATRHYAKRQMTWFRKEKGVRWVSVK